MKLQRPLVHALCLALATLGACGVAPDETLGTGVQALTQCPPATVLEGVDISGGQGAIDWAMVHAHGVSFAVMKATQGTGFTDTRFAANWAGSRAAGVRRGAYHFFDPTVDGVTQANHYLAVVGTLAAGDLPPVLDIECPDGDSRCLGYAGGTGIEPAATLRTRMLDWLRTVEAATGRVPIVYTFGAYFSSNSIDTTGLDHYPLWLANINATSCFTVPTPWPRAAIRQYSWTGTVPGISGQVDLDRFMGTEAELAAFSAGGPAYAAQYVMQSWPLASAPPMTMRPGEQRAAWIELRNVGTQPWDSSTRLATTVARDRRSPFAGPDWVSASRLAQVSGTVMPGSTYRFAFTFVAPLTAGSHDEHFGLVEDGTAWFGDPSQGGPADSVIEALIDVAGAPVDAGTSPDAATSDSAVDASVADASAPVDAATRDAASDGATPASDAGPEAGDAAAEAGDGGHAAMNGAGCGCAVPGQRRARSYGWSAALLAAGLFARARRKRA